MVSVPLHSPQCRVLERGQWLCGRRLLWTSSGPCAGPTRADLCCCGASTAGLWPWQEATCAQCFCWSEPRSWILWKVRFWGPFCVNNGAIFLAAVDLDSDAPYVKAGSVQVGPKPASRIFGSSRYCESVRKSTPHPLPSRPLLTKSSSASGKVLHSFQCTQTSTYAL